MHLLVVLGCCLLVGTGHAAPTPSETFSHNTILISPDVYYVYWKFDSKNITFEVHVKTSGYVGFGITPNGQMAGSDMIIGWVKDGVTYFKDRRATGQVMPTVDSSQNWVLLSGSESGGYTILKFWRPLISCDKTNDLDITSGTMRLIYSYKDTDPTSENSLAYHGATQRGSKSIQLLSDNTQPQTLPSNAQYMDFLNANLSIPTADTTYWCRGFKIPNFGGKRHVVMVEPIVQAGHESLVHHILIYSCWHLMNDSDVNNAGQQCFTANMPGDIDKCTSVMFAWAIGGGKFYFPSHSGYPLGGANDPTYIRMETHYDNPAQKSGYVDASGLRLWYTSTLRSNDAGVLETGMKVSPEHVIPPKASSFLNKGFCSSTCLSQAFGSSVPTGIKVFATMVHTHLVGTGIKVSHVRNGVEQPTLDQDLSYDFNFQETRHLSQEVTVLPTDDLIVSCYYKTTSRTTYTVGGIKSADEMCLTYLYYYPRVNLTKCESVPTLTQTMKIAGDFQITGSNSYPYHKITTNGAYKDKTVFDVMTNTDWTSSSNLQTFENLVTSGPIDVACDMSSTYKYPIDGQTIYSVNITTPYTTQTPLCTPVTGENSAAFQISARPLVAVMLITLVAMFRI